jgi:hypothetical protein
LAITTMLTRQIVRALLADDEVFQSKAREVARAEPSHRGTAAEHRAKDYVPYKSPHQELIVDLLLPLAEKPWDAVHPAARTTFIHQTRAIWVDAPLDALDGRRLRGQRALGEALRARQPEPEAEATPIEAEIERNAQRSAAMTDQILEAQRRVAELVCA